MTDEVWENMRIVPMMMVIIVITSAIAGCTGDISDYEKQISDIEDEYEGVNQTLMETELSLSESELIIKNLDSEIAMLKNISSELSDDLSNSSNVIYELKILINQSEASKEILLSEISESVNLISFLRDRVNQSEETMDILNQTKFDLESAISENINFSGDLNRTIINLNGQIQNLSQEKQILEDLLESKIGEVEDFQMEVNQLSDTISYLEGIILEMSETMHPCGDNTLLVEGECVSDHVVWGRIPFLPGTNVSITQSFRGSWTHQDDHMFAVDFPTSEGIPVVSSRPGVVRELKEDSDTNCIDEGISQEDCTYGNYVLIDHGDFTFALYLHLQQWSVDVSIGETVGWGHQIGRVGNTGYSTGPHLHLVTKNGFAQGNSMMMLFEELIGVSEGFPFSGVNVISNNSNISISYPILPSSCEYDVFAFRGVFLSSEIPCSMAEHDIEYNLNGTVGSPEMKLLIAQYKSTTSSWDYRCLDTSSIGSFSTTIEWDSDDHGDWSYLMLSVANDDCYAFDGWWTSIGITMV